MDKYRNIKKIYIGNVLESFCKSYTYDKMPKKEADFWRRYDALENNRSLLYGGDNKIVITPEKISYDQMDYICALAEWKNVHNLVPPRKSDCISLDILNDQNFYQTLRQIINDNPGVEIIQYRHTRELYELADKLIKEKLDTAFPELVEKADKFIEEYFHSKRGFRHLWEQVKDPNLKISIPDGFIAGDKQEAIEAAWWFRKHQRNFTVKYNKGVQGIGVSLNLASDYPDSYSKFAEQMAKVLIDGMWDEPCIVVEEYIEPNHEVLGGSPSVEMRIGKDGVVHREYACAQVLDSDGKTFLGVTMNPEVEVNEHIQQAFQAAGLYGQKLAELGYRGVFDMDLIVSTENKLFAVEANLRRTGGTHAHEFCKTLLGDDYAKKHYVYLQDMSVPDSRKRVFGEISKKYAFNPKNEIGIIPVNPDMLEVNKAPILIIAPNKSDLVKILGEVNYSIV